jgi:hypothetical protein
MFESKSEKILSRSRFLRRLALSLALSGAVIVFGLAVGTLGYHTIAKRQWVDAFLEASMILTGMGPVGTLTTTAAKLFASFFALFSGLIFISAVTITVAPVLHRLLHKFHLDDDDFKDGN